MKSNSNTEGSTKYHWLWLWKCCFSLFSSDPVPSHSVLFVKLLLTEQCCQLNINQVLSVAVLFVNWVLIYWKGFTLLSVWCFFADVVLSVMFGVNKLVMAGFLSLYCDILAAVRSCRNVSIRKLWLSEVTWKILHLFVLFKLLKLFFLNFACMIFGAWSLLLYTYFSRW